MPAKRNYLANQEEIKMPKMGLYRNISVFFAVFTVMLVVAIFLMFYNQGTIIISASEKSINLDLSVEVRPGATTQTTSDGNNILPGTVNTWQQVVTSTFNILSTKTIQSDTIVGTIKIVNNSNKDQKLVKTTQLQAENNVIVRTNDSVTVPAGGSVNVDVYPKDSAQFSDIAVGNLKIIKLDPALQSKIYGEVVATLSASPHEVKALASSDLARAKQEMMAKVIEAAKLDKGLTDKDIVSAEITSVTSDKQIGDIGDTFNVTVQATVKQLSLDQNQLADLINKKVEGMDWSGFITSSVDMNSIKYEVVDPNYAGDVLVKVKYSLLAKPNENNSLFDKANFTGKTVDEVKAYLEQSDLVKKVEVYVSPYWKKTLPKQASKIKITIQ